MVMRNVIVCVAVAAALVVPALGMVDAGAGSRQDVEIVTPETALYVMGVKLVPLPETPRPFQAIVVGGITVEATADGGGEVSFYVDGELMATDGDAPYTWTWDVRLRPPPIHTVRAESGGESDEIGVLYVNPFGS